MMNTSFGVSASVAVAVAVYALIAAAWIVFEGVRRRWLVAGLLACLAMTSWLAAGADGLHKVAIIALIVTALRLICRMLRALLVRLVRTSSKQVVRSAPLSAIFGFLVIGSSLLIVVFAPIIAPYGEAQIVSSPYAPADATYWLGTDQLGRDLFSRIIFGGRHSIVLSLTAVLLAFVVGVLGGLMAAVRGGVIDQLFGRLADILMSIPALILALLLLSILGTNLTVLVGVVAVIYVPRIFRLTRSVAANVVVTDFVEASRVRGEGDWYLIRKEILPNTAAPLIAEFGLEFCYVFLLVAGLSFLGLGIQPPLADWGSMVRENAALISFGEITPLIPAIAIAIVTVGVNFVVDWMLKLTAGLRD